MHNTTPPFTRGSLRSTLLALSIVALVTYWMADSSAVGAVTVLGVAVNHSAVKIYYAPVPGALDYRALAEGIIAEWDAPRAPEAPANLEPVVAVKPRRAKPAETSA